MNNKYTVGSVVFENWTVKNKLGEGSFGEVFEIERKDFGETYKAALKVITVPQSEAEIQSVIDEGMNKVQAEQYFYSVVEDIVREFAIMSKLKGTANVVSYEDHIVIKHTEGIGWDILIRMELLNPLLPYAYQHPFSRRDVIQLGIDMCKALELCQKYNIIHRDIKPENVFVSDNGDFKLGDFGIARTIERTTSGLSKKGTYNYMAPEVYRGGEYGFSVDIYSLGIVLYRLLNKNRVPFMPPAPTPITFNNREQALAKRMSGEKIPKPFYAEGRLAEIILKACAFNPQERHSNPMQMREELEAILYDQDESELIYPDGDELNLAENVYISKTPSAEEVNVTQTEKTSSVFGNNTDNTGTVSVFSGGNKTESETVSVFSGDNTSRTESVFGNGNSPVNQKVSVNKAPPKKKKKILPIIIAICAVVVVGTAITIGVVSHNKKQEMLLEQQRQEEIQKQDKFETLMTEGKKLCETEPEKAAEMFLEAQKLYPDQIAAYTSYAYALFCIGDYDKCISYIEDDLALGKNYDIENQSKLSEFLGAAYFEKSDYAASASFFRLSTAGGDITVPAMRDYAVSLGRLGDVNAADEVLQKMFAAGASDDVTEYVQAEVNFAKQNYVDAETGFSSVLSSSQDELLRKRSVRSLAEVYRECAKLDRMGKSPIADPAEKEVQILSVGMATFGLDYDSTLWEMLGLAYFDAYHKNNNADYLKKASESFNKVIELGVQKNYLYANLYTIHYQLKDYNTAENVLNDYENAFPDDCMPNALRGMMYITIENSKPQKNRNYSKAVEEYNKAKGKVKSSDDTTYLQQLESLIDELRKKDWID